VSGDLHGITVPEELRTDTALNVWDWLRPQLRAAIDAALDGDELPDPLLVPHLPPPGQLSACHCWCRMSHPRTTGVCMAEEARVVRWVHTELAGLVRVPLCQPCADAWPTPAGA